MSVDASMPPAADESPRKRLDAASAGERDRTWTVETISSEGLEAVFVNRSAPRQAPR